MSENYSQTSFIMHPDLFGVFVSCQQISTGETQEIRIMFKLCIQLQVKKNWSWPQQNRNQISVYVSVTFLDALDNH